MKPFTNSKGFSLAELVVAAGISVIVGGIGAFVLVMAVETYTRMVRQYEAESELAAAMLAVSSTLSNSQKMILGGNISTTANQRTNRGLADPSMITRGYLNTHFSSTSVAGGTFIIASGVTESGVRTDRSNLQGFGIFYQRPTETTSGAIYIDKERNANGWVKISSINARQSFGRFTFFGVTEVRTLDGNGAVVTSTDSASSTANRNHAVLSADFQFTMRYFTKGKMRDFYWCPAGGMTTYCNTKRLEVSHYDITKNLRVVFANNEMEPNPTTNNHTYLADRLFGKVYFFKFLPSIR